MKKRYIVGAVIVVAVAGFYAVVRNKTSAPAVETASVLRGDVRNEVSVTGRLKPIERIDLSFLTGGRVGTVAVDDGAFVHQGDVLARLEANTLEDQVKEAEARLDRENAVLEGLLAPLRTEERALKDTAVATADANVREADEAGRAALARAYVAADDAVHNKADALFYESRGPNPKFGTTFTYGSTEYSINAEPTMRAMLTSERASTEQALARIQAASNATASDTQSLLSGTDGDLRIIERFLDDVAGVVNKYIETDTGSQTVYASYQTSMAAARTEIGTARADILASRKGIQAASFALTTALNDLDRALAGASTESLSAQRAAVVLAEHGVTKAEAQLEDAVIRAPFSGTIANFDLTPGQPVAPYTPVGQLIADQGFALEAYIPEADIASVKLGDTAQVTFDAFSKSDMFTATVVRIAQSDTVREGVPTYKTSLVITASPDTELMLRAGMSADIDIRTAERTAVLYIPTRSILTDNGRTYVRVETKAGIEERTVTTGLRGSEGYTEIVAGLSENEEVVLFVE